MKKTINKILSSVCALVLAGCSATSEDGRTVEAGPLLCLMVGDPGSGFAPMSVTCNVSVGNAEASAEGIDVSVTNILQVNVLPDLCPTFSRAEVLVDSKPFTRDLQAGLRTQYARSGIGWTIDSVACTVTDR